jgi:hypothetical protein
MNLKPIAMMLILSALIIPAEAKKNAGRANKNLQKQIQKEKKEEAAKKAERDRKRKAVENLLAKKDTNKDKFLSREEYLAGEANPEAAGKRFDAVNKNRDRTLTKSEMEALLGF